MAVTNGTTAMKIPNTKKAKKATIIIITISETCEILMIIGIDVGMASGIITSLVKKSLGTQNQEITSATIVVNTAELVIIKEMTQMMN
jgi:hypothetical protein